MMGLDSLDNAVNAGCGLQADGGLSVVAAVMGAHRRGDLKRAEVYDVTDKPPNEEDDEATDEATDGVARLLEDCVRDADGKVAFSVRGSLGRAPAGDWTLARK